MSGAVAEPARGEPVDDERAGGYDAEQIARAGWSGATEPGDAVAGAFVASHGAADTLEAVAAGGDARAVLARLGIHDPAADVEAAIAAGLDRWRPRIAPGKAAAALARAERLGIRMLVPGDRDWPYPLDDLGAHAPHALWVRGDTAQLPVAARRSIALVGARAATGYGEHVAAGAAAGLVDRRFSVVSGAAYGIDAMAHRSALAAGGLTVAFLAGGADRYYPAGNDELLHRIAREGAVVSELPPGESPTRWRFLQRNRLIAAFAQATVVIEAGHRSGSLNTAGHAAALGRPLGAVPGPVTSSRSSGCHRLLREYDAVCVTDAAEMAALVAGDAEPTLFEHESVDPRRIRVLDALNRRTPRTVEEIAARSGLPIREAQAVVGVLSAEGALERTAVGWIRGR